MMLVLRFEVRFGNCHLRVPLMYQPCFFLYCCRGKTGDLSNYSLQNLPFSSFCLSVRHAYHSVLDSSCGARRPAAPRSPDLTVDQGRTNRRHAFPSAARTASPPLSSRRRFTLRRHFCVAFGAHGLRAGLSDKSMTPLEFVAPTDRLMLSILER